MGSTCLAFGVGETRCAVPVDRVSAVVHLSRSMSDGIDVSVNRLKGLIPGTNGIGVPVMDVRREPSFPLEEYDKFSCVVLLQEGFAAVSRPGRQVGVIADSLPAIAGFEWAPQRGADSAGSDVEPYYVIAKSKGEDPAVHLLDVSRVAEDGEVFAIESRGYCRITGGSI